MLEESERLQKQPSKRKPDYSNDWLAAGILVLMLLLAIAGSPAMIDQKEKNDTTQIKNTAKTEGISDTLHKQSIFSPDTSLLFFKKVHEKNR